MPLSPSFTSRSLIQKANPYHDKQGMFTSAPSNPVISPFSLSFGSGTSQGKRVRVDSLGDPNHGKTGRIIRQIGHDHGVELDGTQHTEWFNSGQLRTI